MIKKRTRALQICVVLLVQAASLAVAQPAAFDTTSLQARLDAFIDETGIPGVGAALIRAEGEPVLAVSGRRAVNDDAKVQVEDLWHIGSITKSFTATLTARLIERGTPLPHAPGQRLDWNTRLEQLVPQAKSTAYAEVTVRQLLGMRAGLPANPPQAWFGPDTRTPDSVRHQRKEVALEILASDPTSEPGTAFLYSNGSYILLGAALEETLDSSWEDLLRAHVLNPLELGTADFGPPGTADRVDQPRGHVGAKNDELRAVPPNPLADNPPFLGPAGTLHMRLEDLIRYAAFHLDGAMGTSKTLSADLARHLYEPLEGHAYASGWIRVPPQEGGQFSGPVLLHNGSNTLWYAMVMIAPGHRAAAVVTTNAGTHNRPAVDGLTSELLAAFSGLAPAQRSDGDGAP